MHGAFAQILAFAFLATPARGQTEAEIGAEGGDLALALAERVGPSGRIYATEIEAEKRDEIRAAATARENRARRSWARSRQSWAWRSVGS